MNKVKPKLGQNFLTDNKACAEIVAALGDVSNKTVVEIGPGRGAITSLLAGHARRLIAVEYDAQLASGLGRRFSNSKNVEIVQNDILETDLAELIGADSPAVVVGNLPYYITSPILSHLFAADDRLSVLVLMMQREVAERITASCGTRDYGLLSATVQLYSQPHSLFTLPPDAFEPPPKVYSSVLRFEIHPRFTELDVAPQPFLAFLKSCFQQKRKTLANNLRAAGYAPSQIATALSVAEIDAGVRAEAVSPERMAALFKQLQIERPADHIRQPK